MTTGQENCELGERQGAILEGSQVVKKDDPGLRERNWEERWPGMGGSHRNR